MPRAEMLSKLAIEGRRYDLARLREVAEELDLPIADTLAVAGLSVPARLLPPPRDHRALREFAYRVTHCDHAQLASLEAYVARLAPADVAQEDGVPTASAEAGFANILAGLIRNRGFGVMELPFTGLSRSTINGMLSGRRHTLQQLKAISGPLGWKFEYLAAVAGEPLEAFNDCSVLCRHVGKVYVAAIPLTTEHLIDACAEADRVSGRRYTGAWQPWAGPRCPDEARQAPGENRRST
ncbi:hypothetical protein ACIBKY_21985 [Nonomuraea sp. NPDC050394]|uniref:hypothetical protein n=1 Tax=Nonomuraea sp. NPDC050394 TaxID=3364363 RepID=UPI0037A8DB6D